MDKLNEKPTVSNPLEHVVMLQGDELTIARLRKINKNLKSHLDKNLEDNMDMIGINCVKVIFLEGLYDLIQKKGSLTIESGGEMHKHIKRYADQTELD